MCDSQLDYSSNEAKVMKAFMESVGPVHHQLAGYDHFIQEGMRSVLNEYRTVSVTHKGQTFEIEFGDYILCPPSYRQLDNQHLDATPKMCLDKQASYVSEWLLDFSVKMPLGIVQKHERVKMGNIPVMVMSSLCRLRALKDDPAALIALGEDIHEQGGYFIQDGQAKIVCCMEKMITNRIYVHRMPRQGTIHGEVHNTPLHKTHETIFKTDLIDKTLICSLPYIPKEWIPVSILFYLFGVTDPTMMLHIILPNDDYLSIPGLQTLTMEILERTLEKSLSISTEKEAWAYIGRIGKKVIVPEDAQESHRVTIVENAQRLIDYDLFPHMGEGPQYRHAKACFLGLFIRHILLVEVGHTPSDDRDHMANKITVTPGMLLTSLFGHIMHGLVSGLRKQIIKSVDSKDNINIKAYMSSKKKALITTMFAKAITSNQWIPNKEKIQGLSQTFDKFNYIAGLQCSRKTIKILKKDSGLSEKPRALHNSHVMCHCQSSTPEGKKVGFISEFATGNTISMDTSSQPIATLLLGLPMVQSLTEDTDTFAHLEYTPVLVNGTLIGTTAVPQSLLGFLKRLKQSGNLHPETGIWFQKDDSELHIRTDGGRAIRPCFVVRDNAVVMESLKDQIAEYKGNLWWFLISHGAVEWISKDEEETLVIAMSISDLSDPNIPIETRQQFEYCELSPDNIYGVGASTILFPDHNAAPRNTFHIAQVKQAIGIPGTNAWMHRNHKTYILNAPHKPLAHSRTSELVHATDCPSGTNTVIMVCPFEGANQEDSLVLNLGASQMGLGDFTMLLPYRAIIRTDRQESLEIPTPSSCSNFHGNTGKLDVKRCHVLRGQRVEKGDVLIGIISRQDGVAKSISIKYEHELPGHVYRVLEYKGQTGYEVRHVIIAQHRPLECSDKMSLPCGNKGTISMKYNAVDLPQTLSGLIPEILINPLALPSRMSFGLFFEALTGRKIASTTAELSLHDVFRTSRDSTPFQKHLTMDLLMDTLHSAGIPRCSEERVIDGRTGEMTSVPVFLGINHYQRLKHLGIDKINCLTMDHEVLTDSGWKFFDGLTLQDKIATMKEGVVVYDHPTALHHYPDYEGDFYELNHQVSMKTTMNHRMYVSLQSTKTRKWQPYQLLEARQVMQHGLVKYKSQTSEVLVHHSLTKVTHEKCPVFCVSVPSQIFYVRRNGCEVWTGNSRSKGQRDRLTQQPVEGRAHGGGQRCGVYERDIWFANGAAATVKDRMMDQSDASTLAICKLCGLPALHIHAQPSQNALPERYYCNVCEVDQVTYIRIPYAVKLWIQEMAAMGIMYRLIPHGAKMAIVSQDESIVGETMMIV